MPSMPRSAHTITDFPVLLARSHGNDGADRFVARCSRATKDVSIRTIGFLNAGTTDKGLPITPVGTMASEWQTPTARTLMRTSPSPGCFSSTSSRVNGASFSIKRAALKDLGRSGAMPMVVLMGLIKGRLFDRKSRDLCRYVAVQFEASKSGGVTAMRA